MFLKSQYPPFVTFYDELYRATFLFLVGELDIFKKACNKYFGDVDGEIGEGRFAAYRNKAGEEINVIWLEKWDEEDAVHEATHAAGYVLSKRGYEYSSENDEPFTYYVTWIYKTMKECYESKIKASNRQCGVRTRQKSNPNL